MATYTSSVAPFPASSYVTRSAPAPVYITNIYNPPAPQPVAPPQKINADLYGKKITLAALGLARLGAAPAPLLLRKPSNGYVSLLASFGFPANPSGTRVIYDIALDNMTVWESAGGGTLPAHGTFKAETFDFVFYPGRLDQAVDTHFPGNEIAYRPQMLLSIRNLPYKRFEELSGSKVPYVSCLIGDTTDGADPYDGINVGTALERLAYSPWAGYTADTFEAQGITDVCGALLLAENFTVLEVCEAITRFYRNMDLVQSDKVYIRDRGGSLTPNLVIDRDRIAAGEISIERTAPSRQPRDLKLTTIDPGQDYMRVPSISKRARFPVAVSASVGLDEGALPLALDAATRQAMVDFAHDYEENARKRFSLPLMPYAYKLEQGDLVRTSGLADGIGDEVIKVRRIRHRADKRVEIEAEATLRCALTEDEPTDPFISDVLLLMGAEGGFLIDESPVARPMVPVGNVAATTSWAAFGAYSIQTDGNGDCVAATGGDVAFLFPAGPFTIETIFRADSSTSVARSLVACWANSPGAINWDLYVVPDIGGTQTVGFNWATGLTTSTGVSAAVTLALNTPYRLAVDRDASNVVRLYLDGVMVASGVIANAIPGTNPAQKIRVGSHGSLGTSSFPGKQDEVRVSKRCRYGTDAGYTPAIAAFPRS